MLAAKLTPKAAAGLLTLNEKEAAELEEIRFHTGHPVELVFDGESQRMGQVLLEQGRADHCTLRFFTLCL